MKYIKMLGLLAVAAAALMAFAGTASATLTGLNEKNELHAKNEGNVILTGSAITISCSESTVGGTVSSNTANHVEGPLTTLTFTGCNHTVTSPVAKKGTLTAVDTGTNTADVYSTGAEVTVLAHTLFFGTVHCTYKTNNTTIGTLTGSTHNGLKTATFDIDATIPEEPETSDGLCGATSVWEGSYQVTNPDHLVID